MLSEENENEIFITYSLTNTAIDSNTEDRWWEPDDITAFWETLAAKKESTI